MTTNPTETNTKIFPACVDIHVLRYAIFDMENDNFKSTILEFGGKNQALYLGGATERMDEVKMQSHHSWDRFFRQLSWTHI
jgi:hypothetical protein